MPITDHVAILLTHSLDVARLNKKKTRSDFYAQVALPPAAVNDVAALVAEIYPGIPLTSIEVNFKTNAMQKKPIAGVPNDWYILRLASQFAPALYAADGTTRIEQGAAKLHFFAGQRVRIVGNAWAWKGDNGPAASFNLFGVMDAGQGGERLSFGEDRAANAFKQHANPNATITPVPGAHAQTVAQGPNGNPFAAQQLGIASTSTNAVTTAQSANANPFAQARQANQSNPFAQQA